MAKSRRRPLAVLNLRKYQRIADFMLWIVAIIENIKNNPTMFVTPNPAVATVMNDITDLELAEVKVKSRALGAAAARDQAYTKVLDDTRTLLGYVQSIADAAADEQAAITVIETSGFGVKVNGRRVKGKLEAKNMSISGKVKLMAKAAPKGIKAAYYWQMSADNGTIWTSLPDTLKATAQVDGLTPGSRLLFRSCFMTKAGTTDWVTPVSLIVQ